MTRPRLIPGLLAAVALLLGAAGPADAAPSHKKAIWGPAVVDGTSQFPIYRDLGVGIYQTFVNWRSTAPTRPRHPRDPNDPAYRWDPEIDFAVAEAKRYGIAVALMVLRTPAWANGGRDTTVPPTHAAGLREVRRGDRPALSLGAPVHGLGRADPPRELPRQPRGAVAQLLRQERRLRGDAAFRPSTPRSAGTPVATPNSSTRPTRG